MVDENFENKVHKLLYDTNNGYNLQNKVYYLLNKLFFESLLCH